jgi:hypothetical protein
MRIPEPKAKEREAGAPGPHRERSPRPGRRRGKRTKPRRMRCRNRCPRYRCRSETEGAADHGVPNDRVDTLRCCRVHHRSHGGAAGGWGVPTSTTRTRQSGAESGATAEAPRQRAAGVDRVPSVSGPVVSPGAERRMVRIDVAPDGAERSVSWRVPDGLGGASSVRAWADRARAGSCCSAIPSPVRVEAVGVPPVRRLTGRPYVRRGRYRSDVQPHRRRSR